MVRTGITWTVTIISDWTEYVDTILEYLNENGISFRTDVPKGRYEATTRDDHLSVLNEVELIELIGHKAKQKQQFKLTDKGYEYLRQKDRQQRNRLLHNLFYSGIFHYRYAYDCILEDGFYEFSDRKFHEYLVVRSSNDFGVRFYDRHSYKNVIRLFEGIGIAERDENDDYTIKRDYQLKFNENSFKTVVGDLLKDVDLEYTKIVCKKLLDRSDEFLSVPESDMTIFNILNKLKELRDEGNIEFVAGIPKPPIEAAYTLIRWVRK